MGKTHDYWLLKDLFPPDRPWFAKKELRVDLGFLGISKDYVCLKVHIPHKKSKLRPLTEGQKSHNQSLAGERVPAEHGFAGLKRYRVLSDRARIHDWDLYDTILGVCAGLWNFFISN